MGYAAAYAPSMSSLAEEVASLGDQCRQYAELIRKQRVTEDLLDRAIKDMGKVRSKLEAANDEIKRERERQRLLAAAKTRDAYKPSDDGSHQYLGISKVGMYMLLEEIGFLHFTGISSAGTPNWKKEYGKYSGWAVTKSYARSADLVGWLGSLERKQGDWGLEAEHVLWYDLCEFVKTWLRSNGFDGLSLCEVILTQDRFAHLRQHVGDATVFWSHVQNERVLNYGTLKHIDDFFKDRLEFIWLDGFCLRQCRTDFTIERTVALIKRIGILVADMDNALGYTSRSFCLLEAYAAASQQVTFLSSSGLPAMFLRQKLEKRPIRSKAATTRRSDDKQKIDAFIQQWGGHDKFDKFLTALFSNCD